MVDVRADRRHCKVEEAPEAEKLIADSVLPWACRQADLGLAMVEIERKKSYLRHGFRSARAWVESLGYGPKAVRHMMALGRALRESPVLESRVRAGKITTEAAVELGRLFAHVEDADREAWLRKAESMPARDFADAVNKAIEEARQQEETVRLKLDVTRSAVKNFRRCRRLLSKGPGKWLTEGQTFAHVVADFVLRHDPTRREPRKGRGAKTDGRYIPVDVRDAVEARSGGFCEMCLALKATCKCHLKALSEGGEATVENIVDGCGGCHLLLDAGYYTIRGFDENDKPIFDTHPEVLEEDDDEEVRERPPPRYVVSRRRVLRRRRARHRDRTLAPRPRRSRCRWPPT